MSQLLPESTVTKGSVCETTNETDSYTVYFGVSEKNIHQQAIRILGSLRRVMNYGVIVCRDPDDELLDFFDEGHKPLTIEDWKCKASEHCVGRYFDAFKYRFGDCLPTQHSQFFSLERLQTFEIEVIGPKAHLKHKKWTAFVQECTPIKNYQSVFRNDVNETKVCYDI